MENLATITHARQLDDRDELAPFRDEFVVADPELIYLDGNSLGRLPKKTARHVQTLVEEQWGERLIRSWNEGWIDAPQRIGAKIATIVGARPDEVIVADSTSVNLYRLALAALRAQPGRHTIVTDDLNFPSDLYVLQGICDLLGAPYRLKVIPSADGVHGDEAALAGAMDKETALVTLSHTVFKSAFTYDMAMINQAARRAGAFTLWDLSHAAGSVLVDLSGTEADLAVGCTYKYLNGGPGAPAFQYVRREIQERLGNPIQGWMGQAEMFNFDLEYDPAPGLQRFQTGTPALLSLYGIEPGVDLLLAAGMERLRAKSVAQSEYLIALWATELAPLGFELRSPRRLDRRGSHVALAHPEAWRINQAMIQEASLLPDFRAPDIIRLGITPLYTTFVEIYRAVSRIKKIVATNAYLRYSIEKSAVT